MTAFQFSKDMLGHEKWTFNLNDNIENCIGMNKNRSKNTVGGTQSYLILIEISNSHVKTEFPSHKTG